jgi:TnpA family transposase
VYLYDRHGRDASGNTPPYYLVRRYLTPELVRALAVDIANATFAGAAAGAIGLRFNRVASDSTHFGAWDQNLLTERHSRDTSRGVLIYWHVQRTSMVSHSQLLNFLQTHLGVDADGSIVCRS